MSRYNEGQMEAYTQARADVKQDNTVTGIPRPSTTLAENAEATIEINRQEAVHVAAREAGPMEFGSDQPNTDTDRINVLDKGYVRLVDTMGSDLSVVNAARVSYDKESKEFDGKDERLLAFLARENHTAPFRHAIAQFEVYAPLFVARQWWKHVVGGDHNEHNLDPYLAWNESSRRYVTENEEFYLPSATQWREKAANNKQGSGGKIDEATGRILTSSLYTHMREGQMKYEAAMAAGVAPEMARLFLSANALYVRWRWTSSLQGVMHFINLRDEAHAQFEIQEYARAVRELTALKFPASIAGMEPETR